MKKLLICLFVLVACGASAQTRPSVMQLKENTVAYVDAFGAKRGDVYFDSGPAIQKAIDSLADSDVFPSGGVVQFGAGRYGIFTPVYVPKTGVTLKGMGRSSTEILSGVTATATIQVTTRAFGLSQSNFKMEGLLIRGRDELTVPTALYMREVAQSNITDCMFWKVDNAILLDFCFYANIRSSIFKLVGNSIKTSTPTSTNNNSLRMDNCIHEFADADFRGCYGSYITNTDFEGGMGGPVYTGDRNYFQCNRFEQRNLIPTATSTTNVEIPWFVVGHKCSFVNNEHHVEGGGFDKMNEANPFFKVVGSFNYIDLGVYNLVHRYLVTTDPMAEGNKVLVRSRFDDEYTFGEPENVGGCDMICNYGPTTVTFDNYDSVSEFRGTRNRFTGSVVDVGTVNGSLKSWLFDGVATATVASVGYPLGYNASDTGSFIKLTPTASSGNRRMYIKTGITTTASTTVSLSALIYIPQDFIGNVLLSGDLSTRSYLVSNAARGKYTWVWSRHTIAPGSEIVPNVTFLSNDPTATGNQFITVGAINCVYGGLPAYVGPTTTAASTWTSNY